MDQIQIFFSKVLLVLQRCDLYICMCTFVRVEGSEKRFSDEGLTVGEFYLVSILYRYYFFFRFFQYFAYAQIKT